jgi:hypothetical protein
MKKDNVTQVLNLFIKNLRVPVTKQSIADEIEKHPNCTSLLAISDLPVVPKQNVSVCQTF